MSNKKLLQTKKWCLRTSLCFGVLVAAVGAWPIAAQSGLITQGFQGSANLPMGALVSLEEGSAGSIELSNTRLAERLVGVINEQAFLEFSNADSTLQVVLDGSTPTLVSDLNGEVRKGDYITVSPVAGVGMKATESSIIVGVAQADLSGVSTTKRTIADRNGQSRSVNIGLLTVHVNVASYTAPQGGTNGVSSVLQNIAGALAGRAISPARAIIATVVTILLFTVIAVVLYAAVRSSITSIGRNPLSENSLRKGVAQSGLVVLGIALVGFGIVYVILRI